MVIFYSENIAISGAMCYNVRWRVVESSRRIEKRKMNTTKKDDTNAIY
jgi:hypothetical protein